MHLFSSLGTRLVVVVVTMATIAFAAFVGLTVMRLNQGLERQAEQLGHLSEQKLAQRLQGEALLARARLESLVAGVGRRVENIAQRADIVRAISSGNEVAISELLGRAIRSADLDGAIVLDNRLRVFGAHSDRVGLLATDAALQRRPIVERLETMLIDNHRGNPRRLLDMAALDEEGALAFGLRGPAEFAILAFEPIFDDFGDVLAILAVHRVLRAEEATLEEFSDLDGAGVLVLRGETAISWAGFETRPGGVREVADMTLLASDDGNYLARCASMSGGYRVCAMTPRFELNVLRDEMVRIGEVEGRSLAAWLAGLAALSLMMFAGVTFLASRHITNPLVTITDAVRAVARGDWKSEVPGGARRDEIGDIARAVMLLQNSLEERDRLRSDVANAEGVARRREALEEAIRRFDRVMRSVLLSVSDCVETMDETAHELARVSAVAEGEVVEAAFVTENTVSNVSSIRNATASLSGSIEDTLSQLRMTADGIIAGSGAAKSASEHAEHLASATHEFETVVTAIGELSGQTRMLALNATMQTRMNGAGDMEVVVGDINRLAARVTETFDEASDRVSSVRGASEEAVSAIQKVSRSLAGILHQANAIALAMEQQDAVTREIASNILVAADGTANVSSSVARLKATLEEARIASTKVVAKATGMADEAHRLDSTVKSFLREVTS